MACHTISQQLDGKIEALDIRGHESFYIVQYIFNASTSEKCTKPLLRFRLHLWIVCKSF